jgi:N-acetylmuramoyl-L-alanine amidase
VPPSPYVVTSGEYLTAIAAQNGTTVDEILALPKNADIKNKRPNPEILAPLDIVYLPDVEREWKQLRTGETHTFVSDVPTVTINVILLEEDGTALASKSVTTDPPVSDQPLSTDENGQLTFDVTIDVQRVQVSVDDTGQQFVLCVGYLDPSDTDTGLASRLRHLGHLGNEDELVDAREWLLGLVNGASDQAIMLGVASFQDANGQDVTGDPTDDVRAAIEDAHGC